MAAAQVDATLSLTSAILSTLFLIVGTVGNIYLFCRHVRKPFNMDPTFILLAFMRIADLVSLYGWNLKHVTKSFFNFDPETLSLASCKLSLFFQFFSLKVSAWILVAIMFERYFSINVRNWRQLHINRIKTLSVAFLIVFIICIIEMPIGIINGFVEEINGTSYVRCFQSKQFPFLSMWQSIHSFLYSFIPSCLLLLVWIMLFVVWITKRKITSDDSKSAIKMQFDSITKRLVLVSIAFAIASVPSSIFGIFYTTMVKASFGLNLMVVTDVLMFAYHALNFLPFLFIYEATISQIGFTNF